MIIERNNLLDKICIDISGEYNCEKWGCVEEGICRCYKITKINNISLNVEEIARYLYNLFKNEESYARTIKIMKILSGLDDQQVEILTYWGLENILIKNKIWETDKWDISIQNFYYGEEIEYAYLKEEVINKINDDLKSFNLCRDLKTKTNFLFEKTRVYSGKYEILNVKVSDICGMDCQEFPIKLEFFIKPLGVCHFEEGKWKVIEGGDRIKSSKRKKIYIVGIS